jgi:hypothetical protein
MLTPPLSDGRFPLSPASPSPVATSKARSYHQRLVPPHFPPKCMTYQPVVSQDLHLPTINRPRTDDRHAPVSRSFAQMVLNQRLNFGPMLGSPVLCSSSETANSVHSTDRFGDLSDSDSPDWVWLDDRGNVSHGRRRSGSPALTATGKVRHQTGQECPNLLRGFWYTLPWQFRALSDARCSVGMTIGDPDNEDRTARNVHQRWLIRPHKAQPFQTRDTETSELLTLRRRKGERL